MPRRDWRLRVSDLLAAIDRIGRYTAGLDRAAFERDERTVEAVCFALVVIGEAASHVPQDVRKSSPRPVWPGSLLRRGVSDRPQRDLPIAEVAQLPLADEAEIFGVEGVLAQDHAPHQGAHDHRVAVGHLSEAVEELGQELSLAARSSIG